MPNTVDLARPGLELRTREDRRLCNFAYVATQQLRYASSRLEARLELALLLSLSLAFDRQLYGNLGPASHKASQFNS